MLTRVDLLASWKNSVKTIHFSLCEAVCRENHLRISECVFAYGYDFVTRQPHRWTCTGFGTGVITSSSNLTRLRNEATTLRNRQEFQRNQLTELGNTPFESWAKESFEIATKIAYRNGVLNGSPRAGNKDCTTVAAAPVLPVGYVVNASRIADRRLILAGYRLADLLARLNFD
jgi:S1/P1 Nuclease